MRAALVLAAGGSARFGRTDKLMATLAGRPLLLHAIDRARETGVQRLYVVLSAPRALRLLREVKGVVPIHARQARVGLSATLSAGLAALRPIEREVLIFLGDMPLARAPRQRIPPGANGVRPWWSGEPGHPLLVRTDVARRHVLSGDRGLGHLPAIGAVAGRPGNIVDVDTRATLRCLKLGSRFRAAR